jgi:cell division protein FtsA
MSNVTNTFTNGINSGDAQHKEKHADNAISANKKSPIIVGLDIGTTKIAVIAGRKNAAGKLEILGFGRANSNGVQHGMVLNIDQTIKSIQQALDNCLASNPNLEFDEVYVGIAGHHIKSLQTRGDIVRQNPEEEITKDELDKLISDQYRTYIPAGDQIIDVIPQEFTVDSIQNVTSPIGYPGVKMGANFHIITGDKNAIRNINRAVERTNLKIKDLVLQPLASAAAVMCDQDLEAGVAIVDIGGGTTDLAVFYEGVLKHTAVIPFGGEIISMDIKNGLGVLKAHAEQMKIEFGSALKDEANANLYITIPGIRGLPAKEISVVNLSHIIQSRMSEILDFVTFHLKQVGLDERSLNGGIILTGGGSELKNLIQLTEYITGMNARIGLPNEHLDPATISELSKPMYSTCIGLIIKGFHDYENQSKEFAETFKQVDAIQETQTAPVVEASPEAQEEFEVSKKKSKRKLLDSIKKGIIDIFRENDDNTF